MKNHNMNIHVADELSNKVKCLSVALSQARDIISKLENENDRLKDVLFSLTRLTNKDCMLDSKTVNESVCAA